MRILGEKWRKRPTLTRVVVALLLPVMPLLTLIALVWQERHEFKDNFLNAWRIVRKGVEVEQ